MWFPISGFVQAGFFVSEGGVRMPSYDAKRLADADRRVASAHVTLPALTRRMCRHVRDNLGPVIALIPSNYNRLEVCVCCAPRDHRCARALHAMTVARSLSW